MENALWFVIHLPELPILSNDSIQNFSQLSYLNDLDIPSLGDEPRSVLDFLVESKTILDHDSGYNSDQDSSCLVPSQPSSCPPSWESLSGFQAPGHYFLTELDGSYFNALYTEYFFDFYSSCIAIILIFILQIFTSMLQTI